VILAGAGTSIEPFWKIYAVHHSAETFKLLESYRIGNLKQEKKKPATDDPFSLDPDRSSLLTVLTRKPFNAETPKELSVENLITPNEFHFKRNHLPVPHVDIEKFELEIIDEINNKTHKFKLDDIKTKYPVHTIPVTIQCSGNKRKSMNDYEPVQGLMWDVNAISTAEWTGVKLADILADCKIDFDDERIKHVQFEGLDADPVGARYGASVPKEKVFDKKGDVLIAFQMNGVDIPLDHGFPLRVVVPGVIGARSVKWLSKVVLSNEESKSHWQQNDYKGK
jgi:sulfite oxidase